MSDPAVRAAFVHALVLIVFYAALPIAIGLLLAAALSRARVRGHHRRSARCSSCRR